MIFSAVRCIIFQKKNKNTHERIIKMASFDERLKAAMKIKGISQSGLCQLTSTPKSAMSQYVSGKFIPRQDRAEKLASALGVELAWLLGFEDELLSDREREIIEAYRLDDDFRTKVDELLDSRTVFRAAKTDDGRTAPAKKRLPKSRLERIAAAPETDEEF